MPETGLPEAFVGALQALTDWLEAEQVPHATIGGVAVSLIAQPRLTQDIDAVIWLDASRWESLLKAGEGYGFVPRIGDALGFARRARVLLLRHEGSGVSVDLSCGTLDFEREMIERAATLQIGSLSLKVPTPEDLIITKAVANRPKDVADIESILNLRPHLDVGRIRHWTQAFAQALELPELQENVERLLRCHQPPGQS